MAIVQHGYIIEKKAEISYKKSLFSKKINASRKEVLIQKGREDLIKIVCPEGRIVPDFVWQKILIRLSLVK